MTSCRRATPHSTLRWRVPLPRGVAWRGQPGAPITGKPWLDFAGYQAHHPDEMWNAYEEELRRACEEGNSQQVEP